MYVTPLWEGLEFGPHLRHWLLQAHLRWVLHWWRKPWQCIWACVGLNTICSRKLTVELPVFVNEQQQETISPSWVQVWLSKVCGQWRGWIVCHTGIDGTSWCQKSKRVPLSPVGYKFSCWQSDYEKQMQLIFYSRNTWEMTAPMPYAEVSAASFIGRFGL